MIQEIKKISTEHCILQVENLKCASDDYRQERHMWGKKKKPRRSLSEIIKKSRRGGIYFTVWLDKNILYTVTKSNQ